MDMMDQELKNTAVESPVIGVRCPKCLKLYAVDVSEIRESKPKFQCSKCQTKFWFPFPTATAMQEFIGFPVSWIENDDVNKADAVEPQFAINPEHGDSSGAASSGLDESTVAESDAMTSGSLTSGMGASSTVMSGSSAARSSASQVSPLHQDVGVPHSRRLRDLWNLVTEDYNNEALHQQFIKICQRENNLAFAAKKYAHIAQMMGEDSMAQKMNREIESLVKAWLQSSQTVKKKNVLRNRIVWFGVGTGVLLIALGLSFVQSRNLVGIGAVLSFLTLAMQGFLPSKS